MERLQEKVKDSGQMVVFMLVSHETIDFYYSIACTSNSIMKMNSCNDKTSFDYE